MFVRHLLYDERVGANVDLDIESLARWSWEWIDGMVVGRLNGKSPIHGGNVINLVA